MALKRNIGMIYLYMAYMMEELWVDITQNEKYFSPNLVYFFVITIG
jgi:hypothetical protein